MDLAVLTYQYVDNPTDIPDVWPAEVVELNTGVPFPPDGREGWLRMSQSEYSTYIQTYQSDYDAWAAAHILDPTPALGENYRVGEYNTSNQLSTETWYRDKEDTGNYSVKVKEIIYTYQDNYLLQTETNYYTLGGEIYATESSKFYTDSESKKTYMEKLV
jgi:hypothetical protein